MSGHVFISHGSENRDDADALAAFLEARGVKIWIAPRDVRPGMDYSEALQAAIEACGAFVVLVTDTSNKSPYVRAETEMAFSSHKPIFPVRNSDIKPAAGLAFFLKIRHWTDAYGKGRDASLERLALELQTLCGVASAPDPDPIPAPPVEPAPPSPPPPPPPPAPVVAPVPAPPAAEAKPPKPAIPVDDELLAAAIGPNADYYIRRWRKLDEKGAKTSWNWAACLLSIYWLAYRRLWLALIALVVANVILSLLGAAGPAMARITLLASIGLTFVTGSFGNIWYRKQVMNLIAGTEGLDREAALAQLRQRGGASMPALIGTIAATLALTALAVFIAARQMPRPPEPGPTPDPIVNRSGPDEPVDPAGPLALDRNYLVGRWTDDGNCDNASEFAADGRFIAPDGQVGLWSLEGDQLTVTGPLGSATIRVSPIDQNRMTGAGADSDGSTSTRC